MRVFCPTAKGNMEHGLNPVTQSQARGSFRFILCFSNTFFLEFGDVISLYTKEDTLPKLGRSKGKCINLIWG